MIPWAEYSYNSAWHSSIKRTPFEALYGQSPPRVIDYVAGTTKVDSLDSMLQARSRVLQQLRANIRRAQQKMQYQANKHRKDVTFEVGAFIYVKLKPYRQESLHRRFSQKHAMRFFGSYEIIEKIDSVAYLLDLPSTAKIHNVFHVSLLKLCPNPTDQPPAALPDCFLGLTPSPTPLKDRASRLEDEVASDGGGNDASTREVRRISRQRTQSKKYPRDEYASYAMKQEEGKATETVAMEGHVSSHD